MESQRPIPNSSRHSGFLELWTWIHRATGIAHAEGQLEGLQKRIRRRMVEADITDYGEYLKTLDGPDGTAEFDALINHITIRDTFFYREPSSLQALLSVLGEQPLSHENSPVRIWCAGCATGEEPYTLAMSLEDQFGRDRLDNIEIVATDISKQALKSATHAAYSEASIRNIPNASSALILDSKDEMWNIRPHLRSCVKFEYLNLLEEPWPASFHEFDAVLCRNVLMYFSQDVRRSLIPRLVSSLKPGGTLLVGCHESLHDVAPELTPRFIDDVVLYERR